MCGCITFVFSALCKYSLSLSSSYNNNHNNSNTNNDNNSHNNNNSNKSIIIAYTSVGSYSFLCTFALNVIINTRLSKKSTNPAA